MDGLHAALREHGISAFHFNVGYAAVGQHGGLEAHLTFKAAILQDIGILRVEHHQNFAVNFRSGSGVLSEGARSRAGCTAEEESQGEKARDGTVAKKAIEHRTTRRLKS